MFVMRAYHKKNRREYIVRGIRFGIGSVLKQYVPNIEIGIDDNAIESITIYNTPGGKNLKHTFFAHKQLRGEDCGDINDLEIRIYEKQ